MKLLLAVALAVAIMVPIRASAASAWVLKIPRFSPCCASGVVAGPFATSRECEVALFQQSYQQGVTYNCQIIFY